MKYQLFPKQAIPKIFLSQSLLTMGILQTEFVLIWKTLWPDEKDLFSNFANLKIRKFPYEKKIFFLRKLLKEFDVCFTL